ncbi:MAG TPA: valine--tRNA ligase [Acidobacteriaceae bacterium]
MSSELPKAYEPSLIEEKWAKFWVEQRLFEVPTPPLGEAPRKHFIHILPPPNVTGRLHMGHMLNQTEMDILTRWHRMRGETAIWVPGTDHAGIATQMMVERQLAAEGGPGRTELGREAFTERVWQWKQKYGGAIGEQMQRLGASVDWSREYFTMDERLSRAVKEAFVRLWEQGLIYRGAYIVNWDPVLATAVSDLEVVHEERAGKLYHIRYPLADGTGSIVIATTRPETMLGDVAVAVNPADERYKQFVGKTVVLPLSAVAGGQAREIPMIADEWANPEFGTGAVKVTPAHDPNDFAIGQRHKLPQLSIMDEHAHIRLEGSAYDGQDRFVAREHIVEDLRASGALVDIQDHVHSIGLSQRTGEVIEPRLSMQWFIKIQPLADKAIEAVDKGYIRFTPENYRKTYDEWMRNIHDWCISRQLWWGHRIPAWHCAGCGEVTVAREAPNACSHCGAGELMQETDVLDTWFSSGLLPFTVFGWPGEGGDALTADLAAFYPTDLLVTGFDILFFWVARMIMLGCHFMLDVPMPDGKGGLRARTLKDAVPFREVYIHALVRDAERQKMSKTKGNVIDPIDVITKYGTDAVRFTLASQASPGTDIAFSEARTEGNRAFANKIWNAARFLQMQIERGREAGYKVTLDAQAVGGNVAAAVLPEGAPLETRWIFARLSAVCGEVARSLNGYRFDEAANAVYQFFWGEFCDWYVELVKLRLDFAVAKNDTAAVTLESLVKVFDAALRLLSPFMPFLTEESWQALYASIGVSVPAKSIALTRYPQAEDFPFDEDSIWAMEILKELIVSIRSLRKEMSIPEKETVPVQIFFERVARSYFPDEALLLDFLGRSARVAEVRYVETPPMGANARSTGAFDVAVVYERQIDVAAERERLLKELAKFDKGLQAAERQLGNDGFVAKAPAHIVEGLKKQAAETRALKEKAEAALAALPVE